MPGPTPAGRVAYQQELHRALSMKENILITLSAVTPASSVFIIVPTILLGVGGASVLTMLVGGFAAIFVALCYAELSATYPITGGEYTWAARLLGKPVGFAIFMLTLVSAVLIIAVIALGTGEYLGVAWEGLGGKWIGVAVIVVTTFVALLNIRTNAWVTGIFLAVEIAAVAVVAVLGFVHVERGPAEFLHAQVATGGVLANVGVGAVVALVPVALFAYNGYGAAIYYVEETKNAAKNIGRVIIVCLFVTVAVEIIPLAAVVLGAPSMTELLSSDAPMNYFLVARGGSTLNVVVSIGIAIAIINAVIAIILQVARQLFASARDRSWPDPIDRVLSAVHPKLHTPVAATLVVGACAVLAASFVPLDWLITATGAGVVAIYLAVALAALRLRRPGARTSAGYRMPLWPLPPIVVIAMMAYVTYQLAVSALSQLIVAAATIVIGAVYYYAFIHPRRGERWQLADPIVEADDR
ncbi:amino acid transporter [Mycobacterium aquaticum]|uniref:Amino acid transporter n=1 Tax=Mycobacterium aquaticum TaxID=1927124 RepID=A0A1X0A027_9MYCO|nr:amino acid transporter [Mycobacterium aquaticum]